MKVTLSAVFANDDGEQQHIVRREMPAPVDYLTLHDELGELVLQVLGATIVRNGALQLAESNCDWKEQPDGCPTENRQ